MRPRGIGTSAALLIALLIGPPSSNAQNLDPNVAALLGTIAVVHEPYMNGGKLAGCLLRFNVLQIDEKYKVGSVLKVDGSFGVLTGEDGGAGMALKVVVNRVDAANSSLEPAPPDRAYVVASNYSTSAKVRHETFPGELPGSLFVTFEFAKGMEFLFDALDKHRLIVAFNQRGGKSDILSEIDLLVADTDNSGKRTRNTRAIDDTYKCLKPLADGIR